MRSSILGMDRVGLRLLLVLGALIVSAPTARADWVSEIGSSQPLHWFRFEETGGTTADDQGSANMDGTYLGGVSLGVPGLVGNAAGFQGAQHVLVGASNLSTDWTAEFIFLADTAGAGASQGLIGSDFTAADRAALKAEQWNQTGQMGYTLFGVVDVTFTDALAATPSGFAHVVFVGQSSGVSLFVNGQLVGSDSVSMALSRYVIGAAARRADGSLIDGLTGAIDELVIYDRALGSSEISAHYGAVPEPASTVLALLGLLGLVRFRRTGP